MDNEKDNPAEDVASITLVFATPFLAGVPFREEKWLLKKDEVTAILLQGIASQNNPRKVFSYRVNAPFQKEEDRLKDYGTDFLHLSQMVLAYQPASRGAFHPRMTDMGYPYLSIVFENGEEKDIRDLPLTLTGDPALEKIVALMKKYLPKGIN